MLKKQFKNELINSASRDSRQLYKKRKKKKGKENWKGKGKGKGRTSESIFMEDDLWRWWIIIPDRYTELAQIKADIDIKTAKTVSRSSKNKLSKIRKKCNVIKHFVNEK